VPADQVFGFWDWVGGRYSIWSSVGLSCAVALGYDVFARSCAGAPAMDEHFRPRRWTNAPGAAGAGARLQPQRPGRPIRAVVPYAQRLRLFAAFLQQLEMESNGKRVDADGRPSPHPTAASVFGDAGTNGQHAFFQLLHQGTDVDPVDIVAVREGSEGDPAAQTKLLANAIAQAEALMVGARADVAPTDRPDAATPAPRDFPGNRPSSFILLDRLTRSAGRPDRALRAQDLRRGRAVGDQQLRPVGRGARQDPGDPGAGRTGGRAGRAPRPLHRRPDRR
jgi:glucose-6-phosphate isomerase